MEERRAKIRRKEVEYVVLNGEDASTDVRLRRDNLKRSNTFKYLGSPISSDVALCQEITMQSDWSFV